MKYIELKREDLENLCNHYNIDISIFKEYGGAILYEDGTLYPYQSHCFPSPICDHPGLLEDYQYYISQGYTPID